MSASGTSYTFTSTSLELNGISITKINWSILQNIQNIESNNIKGVKPNSSVLELVDVKLNINIEIHDRAKTTNPYYDNTGPLWQCSNTCVLSKKIEISELSGYIENILIPFTDNFKINNTYTFSIKVDVPSDTYEKLKGVDSNGNILYGNIPFNQISTSFDIELQN
jgi:hypothetical protein